MVFDLVVEPAPVVFDLKLRLVDGGLSTLVELTELLSEPMVCFSFSDVVGVVFFAPSWIEVVVLVVSGMMYSSGWG